ncbi:4'-phosphopantetheinyl transferase superfamily protein [Aquibium sp. ELW1220]|uniref:4'-phosphopantetheinyl transferase family protein n=1 Tax=Aquibium sp. ELW1220 TaxID=2976766 RepID=UPI0025AF14DE|nr:4'-phosphopantetheinyl transferase superfamily protein [Aquibium sp. ELW1220]MDN2584305.1 4'-phosphopantetheinyl transferase superfamily protein [Aquibium sp. ELW1220]
MILYAQTTELNDLHSHRRYLNSEESERLKLFRSTEAAHDFLAARMLTRLFHARWLSCNPDEIRITAREHCKPELILPEGLRTRDLPCFSISHSAGWIAIAIHRELPIGVDIELSTTCSRELLDTMRQIYTPTEAALVATEHDDEGRRRRFLTLWRAKEAVMKATGLGFALPPISFTVLDVDGKMNSTVDASGRVWRLECVALTSECEAACAWEHRASSE